MPVTFSFEIPKGTKGVKFEVNPFVEDDKIFQLPSGNSKPPYLYRYRSLATESEQECLRRTILHHEVYLAPLDSVNDPFENRALIVTEDGKSVFDTLDCSPENQTHLEITGMDTFAKFFNDRMTHMNFWSKVNNILGILSFSELSGHLLMWSHYAENHRGVCLQFRNSTIIEGAAEPAPVHYQQEYPTIVVKGGERTADHMLVPIAMTKSRCWEYEREWRLVSLIKGSRLVTYQEGALSGVIMGARMRPEDQERVISWVKQSQDEVALFGASLRDNEYSLQLFRYK